MQTKEIAEINIPYWYNKKLTFQFYWSISDDKMQKILRLTIWEFHKMTYCAEYKDEWGTRWWHHFTLFKKKIK